MRTWSKTCQAGLKRQCKVLYEKRYGQAGSQSAKQIGYKLKERKYEYNIENLSCEFRKWK